MMHAQGKMGGLKPDVVLKLQLSSMGGPQNVLTIHSDGRVAFQPEFRGESRQFVLDTGNNDTIEDYVRANLPAEQFLELEILELEKNYYEIPSEYTCGTAANLFLRIGRREHWVGIWNFGRGEIPACIDAGMYDAALQLANRLANEEDM